MKRLAILVAVTALTVAALFAGQAGADGGGGASVCSNSGRDGTPGHLVQQTGIPTIVASICNPHFGP